MQGKRFTEEQIISVLKEHEAVAKVQELNGNAIIRQFQVKLD